MYVYAKMMSTAFEDRSIRYVYVHRVKRYFLSDFSSKLLQNFIFILKVSVKILERYSTNKVKWVHYWFNEKKKNEESRSTANIPSAFSPSDYTLSLHDNIHSLLHKNLTTWSFQHWITFSIKIFPQLFP